MSLIRSGLYGTTIIKDGAPLYLRMELLTEENWEYWNYYKKATQKITTSGILIKLLAPSCIYHEVKDETGLTEEEYLAFIATMLQLKHKVIRTIRTVYSGVKHMYTEWKIGQQDRYIVYISTNPNFDITSTTITDVDFTLQQYIGAYHDLLITMGANFSLSEDRYENRGISRNPYWIIKQKYSGLSMLLHGFTGVVASQYFPTKFIMNVAPIGSMLCIIKDHLLPGEGWIHVGYDKEGNLSETMRIVDITDLRPSIYDCQCSMSYIKVDSLIRIFCLFSISA